MTDIATSQALPDLANRQSYLGGSDAAAILGLDPWKTRLKVWCAKTGRQYQDAEPEVDAEREKRLQRGKDMEPVVIRMAKRELGLRIIKRSSTRTPNRYRHPEHPFLAAEIDFETEVNANLLAQFPQLAGIQVGTTINGEVKTSHPFAAGQWGEIGTDEIPMHYASQGMHGMGVTGRQATLFLLLVGSDNLVPYMLLRDEEVINALTEAEVKFWTEHVQADVPPDPMDLPDAYHLLKRKQDSVIEATDDLLGQITTWKQVKQDAKMFAERADELKFQIVCAVLGQSVAEEPKPMPKHLVQLGGKKLLAISYRAQSRLDQKRLAEEQADLVARYQKQVRFFDIR